MKKNKIFLFLTLATLILNNCGGFKDAMDPQRKNKTDEFLVEKKLPLSIPPDFEKLPIPINENIEITFRKPSFFLAFKNLKVISFSSVEINFFLFFL